MLLVSVSILPLLLMSFYWIHGMFDYDYDDIVSDDNIVGDDDDAVG